MGFCPLCLNNNGRDDREKTEGDYDSVVSGVSRLTEDTGESECGVSRLTDESGFLHPSSSRRNAKQSYCNLDASVTSRKSTRSLISLGSRSLGSVRSTTSWRSNGSSKKRIKKSSNTKDDSFLPLDGDGYCIHHPGVQLAKISKKGGWRVLMDFCPGKSSS